MKNIRFHSVVVDNRVIKGQLVSILQCRYQHGSQKTDAILELSPYQPFIDPVAQLTFPIVMDDHQLITLGHLVVLQNTSETCSKSREQCSLSIPEIGFRQKFYSPVEKTSGKAGQMTLAFLKEGDQFTNVSLINSFHQVSGFFKSLAPAGSSFISLLQLSQEVLVGAKTKVMFASNTTTIREAHEVAYSSDKSSQCTGGNLNLRRQANETVVFDVNVQMGSAWGIEYFDCTLHGAEQSIHKHDSAHDEL